MTYTVFNKSIEQASGGERVKSVESFSCRSGCIEKSRTEYWLDFTEFVPDLSDDPIPPGFCFLKTSLLEIIWCEPESNDRSPIPLPCSSAIRTIGTWDVAVDYVTGEIHCQITGFKPFHRLGVEDDIVVTEDDEFGDTLGGSTTRTRQIARSFVQNFKHSDMRITGHPWLKLRDGWLIGKAPETGTTQQYDFTVSARNRKGSDSVALKIIVNP